MAMVHLLLVEDDFILSTTVQKILGKEGYGFTACVRSGEAALEVLQTQKPDLILMDIHLQGRLTGIETAQYIMKTYRVPVIYITQDGSNELYHHAIQTFPINYISKPFTESTLIRAVHTALQFLRAAPPQGNTSEAVFIYSSPSIYKKIPLHDIIFVGASGAYTDVYIHNEKDGGSCIKITRSSNKVIGQLNNPSMIQVHRSYFVNLQRIERYHARKIYIGPNIIPVSKTYQADLENRLPFLRKVKPSFQKIYSLTTLVP